MMASERDFEIVDKRRVHPDEAPRTEPDELVAGQTLETEATNQPEDVEAGELPPLQAEGLIRWCTGMLADGAWAWLGLMPDPMTDTVKRDLPQARMAIDAVRALARVVEEHLPASDHRELHTLMANLQVNFVQQSAKEARGESDQ
jgi:hypothetical protein